MAAPWLGQAAGKDYLLQKSRRSDLQRRLLQGLTQFAQRLFWVWQIGTVFPFRRCFVERSPGQVLRNAYRSCCPGRERMRPKRRDSLVRAMSRPLKLQIVEEARSLIADKRHWCRGQLAEDARGQVVFPTSAKAVRRCGLGAVIAAAFQLTRDYDTANELANSALLPHTGVSTLVHVNDVRGHAAVLALFDEVISFGQDGRI